MALGKWEVSGSLGRASQRSLGSALLIMVWIYGLIVVKGFWPMAVAIVVPMYSWYLAIESIARTVGLPL